MKSVFDYLPETVHVLCYWLYYSSPSAENPYIGDEIIIEVPKTWVTHSGMHFYIKDEYLEAFMKKCGSHYVKDPVIKVMEFEIIDNIMIQFNQAQKIDYDPRMVFSKLTYKDWDKLVLGDRHSNLD